MTDFTTYQPPGVYVDEEDTPLVSVIGTTPSVVAIVGPSVGYRTFTESIALTSEDEIALTQQGVDVNTITVSAIDGTPFNVTTDYEVTIDGGEDENSGTTEDNIVSVNRVSSGDITDGQTVRVTYRYTDTTYFSPLRLSDFDDVKQAFGEPINTATGEITSPLSLAAKLAFDNGAREVLLVATDGSASVAQRLELEDGLAKLEPVYDLSIVVPLPVGIAGTDLSPGDTISVGTDLATHCESLSEDGYFRIGIIGYETTATISPETVASSISSHRVMLAHPNKMLWYNGWLNQSQEVAGYYLAAAYAGRLVSGQVQDALTKKSIRGFAGIAHDTFATMTASNKNAWSDAGVAVTELTRTNSLICRHGVSTDRTSEMTREVSLTRAKDLMIRRLQDTVDASGVIGTAIDETTTIRVKGIVQGVLEQLTAGGTIFAYSDLKARQKPGSPTVIEVKFMYRPSYPLNYVLISFSIDTTTGAATVGTPANQ